MFLSLLSKIPFLGTAATFLTSKFRLVIEYALIAAVVIIAGVAVALWGAKKKTELVLAQTETRLTTSESRLSTVESVNQANLETINQLTSLRSKDASAIDGLLTDYRSLSNNDTAVRTRLQTLERSNEAVRDYLNQPVPTELACLLNGTCATGDKGSDKDSATGAAKFIDTAMRPPR